MDNDDNILQFPSRTVPNRSLPTKSDLEVIAGALSVLKEEKEQRPKLVALLEKYPRLLGEYLTIPQDEKEALERFRAYNHSYFKGVLNGDYIRQLTDHSHGRAAMIARKYRWSEQLTDLFDFYWEGNKDVPFTNQYLRKNPRLQKEYGTKSATLVGNITKHDLEVADIVVIVANVRPPILDYYQEPGYKSPVRYFKP